MRLRPKRFTASVAVKADPRSPRPITLRMGPALEFDFSLDEAHTLAVALAAAIESAPARNHHTERKNT